MDVPTLTRSFFLQKDLGLVAGHHQKTVVWSSPPSSSAGGFRGLSIDSKTHIAEAYFKLREEEEEDHSSESFSAIGTFRNGSTQREQVELWEDDAAVQDNACLRFDNDIPAPAEISNVKYNMDMSGSTESAAGALNFSVTLQRPIKLNNASSQTISLGEDSNDENKSIVNNSQEPDDEFHIPDLVKEQGNLDTGFDNLKEGAKEMSHRERIQDSLLEHEGGLIRSSQHTSYRESEDNELHVKDDVLEYYVPSVGDSVIGVVVSSNHSKLDIDIGAQKLGHMFVKDLMSLDQLKLEETCWKFPNDGSFKSPCVQSLGRPRVVHDEEVLRTEIQTPSSPVELGTVLFMEVKGETMSGRPLLSTRSVVRGFAWKRIHQIRELNEPIEIQITQWNPTGLVSRIEGIRAFLPVYHLFKQSTQASVHSLKDYVGRRLCVSITAFDEKTSNLIISEKQAWKIKNLHPGTVVDGIIIEIHKFGAIIKIKETDISGLLHISNIARAHVHDIRDVFSIGEQVKVMVVKSPTKNRIAFSTADLESEDGLMLTDKERVYREAEQMAKALRDAQPVQESGSVENSSHQDLADFVEEEKPIANRDWLDYE